MQLFTSWNWWRKCYVNNSKQTCCKTLLGLHVPHQWQKSVVTILHFSEIPTFSLTTFMVFVLFFMVLCLQGCYPLGQFLIWENNLCHWIFSVNYEIFSFFNESVVLEMTWWLSWTRRSAFLSSGHAFQLRVKVPAQGIWFVFYGKPYLFEADLQRRQCQSIHHQGLGQERTKSNLTQDKSCETPNFVWSYVRNLWCCWYFVICFTCVSKIVGKVRYRTYV